MWKIWILVPIVYAIFSFWYFNWRGPITPEEVDAFMVSFNQIEGREHTDAEIFRECLERADGG